jgi:2-oxoglutarate dehydrogenase E1 component
MALDFRMKFQRDVFIDLLGYRKYGHNEGDEPRFTQPKLYASIAKQPNPRDIYIKKLVAEGIIDEDYAPKLIADFKNLLEKEYEKAKDDSAAKVRPFMENIWSGFMEGDVEGMLLSVGTKYPRKNLENIAKVVSTVPDGVKFLRKAEKILRDRANMVFESNKLDWSMAEIFAFGSLMEEGYNIRFSGQDVERGTFSHRHAVLRDEISTKKYNLLNTNPKNRGEMFIYNSSLSEYGVLGFDYGYAMAAPNTLTIWEAQFGDFSNGAQIIFDQYMSAAEDKWKQQNGIVILLPHGYEGQGSEHSSARIERFLQLCGNDNMAVANCTTPANFFHLLRRQMKRNFRKPLVVFTPKSLLRHPVAVSTMEEFSDGEFQEVIDDTINPENVKRVVLCSGKFYYDLLAERENLQRDDIALIRLEQYFPLHTDKLQKVIHRYTNAVDYIWAQEEPRNMGAWGYLLQRCELENLKGERIHLEVRSRRYYSVPAAGSSTRFKRRHQRVIESVFDNQ